MTTGLTGSRAMALLAAKQTASRADRAAMGQAPLELQQFAVAPLLTQVRFGDWEAILSDVAAQPEPPYPTAIRHFARGMAQVRLGRGRARGRRLARDRARPGDGQGELLRHQPR